MRSALLIAAVASTLLVAVAARAVPGAEDELFAKQRDGIAFRKWSARYRPAGYASRDESARKFDAFRATLRRVEEKNARAAARAQELGLEAPTVTFGVNQFSDWTVAEFKRYLTFRAPEDASAMPQFELADTATLARPEIVRDPTAFDWRLHGAISPVKDQGQCGSCWAFSATQVIESSMMAQGLPVLAPQQIVDCDTNGQDQGCNGGDPRGALSYVAQAGGLDQESQYPYTGTQGNCQYSGSGGGTGTSQGPVDVGDGDENALVSFLQNSGPPSVCVDASSWSSYTGGVLTSCGCNVDHAVQATGITNQFGTPAYIVRNSWNTDWGVNGFIYLAIGSNTCCVANEVTWTQPAGSA